jgi:hypothetical protein
VFLALPPVRLQRGEHNMCPSKQLCDLRRDIAETFRVNDRRGGRPSDLDNGGKVDRLDKLNLHVVVVDLAAGQWGDGMIHWGLAS